MCLCLMFKSSPLDEVFPRSIDVNKHWGAIEYCNSKDHKRKAEVDRRKVADRLRRGMHGDRRFAPLPIAMSEADRMSEYPQ
jgi:hypothetical protein